MPKSGTFGSVRGVSGNRYPYRDQCPTERPFTFRETTLFLSLVTELNWNRCTAVELYPGWGAR